MTINTLVYQLCRKDEVGFVYVPGCFVWRVHMFTRDGLHPCGKGAVVFADEL